MTTKVKTNEFIIQVAATMCVSFLGCQSGFISAWLSYTTAMFRSNETVLSMPMTSGHISLLGSLPSAGGVIVTPFCSYAFNKFGRKYATVLFGIPFVLAWSIISLSSNVYLILLAMTLAGVGMAGQSFSVIFISEISHDLIRENSKSSQRALIKTVCLIFIVSMMGPVMLQVFAEPIFMEAVPSFEPNQCAVIVSLMNAVSSLVCILAIDKCGRQSLLIYTATVCGVCMILLGTLLQFHWAPEWVTAALIYVFCFSYTTGCCTTPFVLMGEVFLPEVKSLCNSITITTVLVVNFITLAAFMPLMEWCGLGPIFYMFSAVGFSVAVYSKIYIPETKGMSMMNIQELFSDRTDKKLKSNLKMSLLNPPK